MEETTEKQLICNALKEKRYQVEYIPANCFFEGKRKDGSIYYVQWEMSQLGEISDMGSFTFVVEADKIHRFIYDMNEGVWSGDELASDEDIVGLLKQLDEFIDYQDYPGYYDWQIYCKVNNIDEEIGCYWYDEEDCPFNVELEEEEEEDEIAVPISYTIYKNVLSFKTFSDLSFVIDEDDLAEMRDYVKGHKMKGTRFQLTESDLWEFTPDLCDEITGFVTYHAKSNGYDPQNDRLEYQLLLSKQMFKKYL